MITAQRIRATDREMLIGMSRGGNDNKQFVLNVLHWLSKLI
ncbi:MAG: DUF4350 domain-containing protein, partial [Acidobacteria bacterium]|nr:DUF4350 domain-containing protein [Acidobacteriota bacterium]